MPKAYSFIYLIFFLCFLCITNLCITNIKFEKQIIYYYMYIYLNVLRFSLYPLVIEDNIYIILQIICLHTIALSKSFHKRNMLDYESNSFHLGIENTLFGKIFNELISVLFFLTVATAHASRAIGKTREDTEIHKTTGGLHKINASKKKRIFSTALGINQLPASTFLIPITSNNTSTSNVEQSESSKSSVIDTEQGQDIVPHSSIILNQQPRSSISYAQTEEQVSYPYQMSSTNTQSEKHQSYLIVKKIAEPTRRSDQLVRSQNEDKSHSPVLNYQLPTTSGYGTSLEAGIVVAHSLLFGRNRKKQTNRAIPALNRIIDPKGLLPVSNDYQLERTNLNIRKPRSRYPRSKLCINQSVRSATEILLPSYDNVENDEQLQITKTSGPANETTSFDNRGKFRPRSGALIHSLFAGHNKPYIVADYTRESRGFGTNDRDYPLLRQHLCRQEHELESRQQSDKPATAGAHHQRRGLTRFFEHVKLEKAHISAPFRTKLVHKKEISLERSEFGMDDIVQENEQYDDNAVIETSPLAPYNSVEDLSDKRSKRNCLIMNGTVSKNSRNNIANIPPLCSPSGAILTPSDLATYERTHIHAQSTMAFQSTDCESDRLIGVLPEELYIGRQQKDDRAAALRIAQSNLLELRNEVSVPDDKADTERQDLPSGRLSSNSSGSGDSDTPEQAMNDATNLFEDESDERLDTNSFSPDGREELEQYESTMHEADRNDAATD